MTTGPPTATMAAMWFATSPLKTNAESAAHHHGEHRGDEDLDDVTVDDEPHASADHVVRLHEARRRFAGRG